MISETGRRAGPHPRSGCIGPRWGGAWGTHPQPAGQESGTGGCPWRLHWALL